MTAAFWQNKRVFVTGHTGFKGSWLCLWLKSMGAEVHGFSLPPLTEPNLFEIARVDEAMTTSAIEDIRDYDILYKTISSIQPEIVFHLAAQPLVRYSYKYPVETYAVNVMGTVHLLEAIRNVGGIKAVLNVTSDKCYENTNKSTGYCETEPMGGHDPYSSSKGCAELVTSAYRNSFLADNGIAIATARAGNVIGGGDWSEDRLLPDIFRAIDSGTKLNIRSPDAVRPWQHVLEPLSGYIGLTEKLYIGGNDYAEGWNFGPDEGGSKNVSWIVEYLASRCPDMKWEYDSSQQPHEASNLRLDSNKASKKLGWAPGWNIQQALDKTIEWHSAWRDDLDMHELTISQINEYQSDIK